MTKKKSNCCATVWHETNNNKKRATTDCNKCVTRTTTKIWNKVEKHANYFNVSLHKFSEEEMFSNFEKL